MLHPPALCAIARQMKAAQDEARQIEPFSAQWSGSGGGDGGDGSGGAFDVPSAYQAARLVHEMRLAEGALPVGRKLGFTNPAMWTHYGVGEPIWAHVYDTTVVAHRFRAARRLFAGAFHGTEDRAGDRVSLPLGAAARRRPSRHPGVRGLGRARF